jgi:hypothetical protein
MNLAALVVVHIVSRVTGSEAAPDDTAKHARADQGVTLFAVVGVSDKKDQKNILYYSNADEVRIGGKKVKTRPLSKAPEVSLRWFKIEPSAENLSNTETGTFAYRSIDYEATEVSDWKEKWEVGASVRPTLTPDRGNGLGTMRYQVTATVDGTTVSSPGVDARRGRGSGGLDDSVHRVSLRRDDTYVGWLTELYGQPYIWASAGSTSKTHQSERLEGSDCADFVTYGWRRLGHDVPYTWTEGLRKYTRRIGSGKANAGGVYVDKKGNPIPFPRVGDLVLFPRHVGVLVEDRGTIGVLDTQDRMAHTLFESPHEEPIADSGYAGTQVDVMRWKE